MIVYIKNIDIEGPATLGDYFHAKGEDSTLFDLSAGDRLPEDINEISAVVCLGGPMNVYEEDAYPFLKEETAFIQNILEEDIPFLGLCLGSQLLNKAMGARVGLSPGKEVGFSTISLSANGKKDPLFNGLPDEVMTFQWHEDMSELSDKATLLASSAACPIQAFKYSDYAYGLQFHVEITDRSIKEWSDKYVKEQKSCNELKTKMLADYVRLKKEFDHNAQILYDNFYKLIKKKRAS